jgi:hypothetical protein
MSVHNIKPMPVNVLPDPPDGLPIYLPTARNDFHRQTALAGVFGYLGVRPVRIAENTNSHLAAQLLLRAGQISQHNLGAITSTAAD